jgi:shikimate dehydrogenase
VIDGSTRVFALLGDPVAHSLSPAMQNAAFRALGLPAVYVPLRCAATDLTGLLRALAAAGGGGNVTIPHKEAAAAVVDRCLAPAVKVGACNTFWADDGAVLGDNSDIEGLLSALDRLGPLDGPWLIAGTGGAARAAAIAAAGRGAAIAVRSRSTARQQAFESWAAVAGVEVAPPHEARVLINATPLGLRSSDPLPIPADLAPEGQVALDMVYAPGGTRWVRVMRARGLRSADGRDMLVAQGAGAFRRWFPSVQPPVEVMRAAVHAILR